jgi:hypothetical protein
MFIGLYRTLDYQSHMETGNYVWRLNFFPFVKVIINHSYHHAIRARSGKAIVVVTEASSYGIMVPLTGSKMCETVQL